MQTPSPAVPSTNPTPAQIAAAKAIMAAAEQQADNEPTPTEDIEQVAPDLENGEEAEAGNAAPAIDQAAAEMLRQMLERAVASNFFMSNSKRVAALETALTIPVSDDKSFQQFYNHSEKDLESAANQTARKSRSVPEEVTKAMVMVEAQKRYVAKHGKRAIVNEEYET